jgi:hypothetical protein
MLTAGREPWPAHISPSEDEPMHAAFFAAIATCLGATMDAPAPAAKPTLSGPYTHSNLTLFLIHGPDTMPGRRFVTLKEAMEKKIIVVNETSNVNVLSIENTSPDVEVFVMAGDVVKGGKQDRAIAFDQIIPPKSGTMALPSFCVEAGRWRKRGAEDDRAFARSDNLIVGKAMKVAVIEGRAQGQVWEEVANAQKKLTENVGKPVQAAASPSSLQLALEDKDLKEKLSIYETPLADAIKDKNDVIGVVAIVNGEIAGADAFCNADLFRTLWPKLLNAASTEALAEFKAEKKFEPLKPEAVAQFLDDADNGESKEVAMNVPMQERQTAANVAAPVQQVQNDNMPAQQLQGQVAQSGSVAHVAQTDKPAPPKSESKVRVLRYTAAKSLLFECREKSNPANVVHRSFIAK